jgi:hypothetical protein
MWNMEIENAICKARGILNNVMDAHEDPRHEHLVSALWAADGLLEQAMKAYEGGLKNETSPYNDAEFKAELDELFSQRAADEHHYEQEAEEAEEAGEAGEAGEDEEDAEEGDEGEDFENRPRFNVDLVKEHEDGSATFSVNGSKKSMQKLFEAFFIHALINGVLLTKEENDQYCAQHRALEMARDLEVLLRKWETSDDFDYDPMVKATRVELSKALKEAGI